MYLILIIVTDSCAKVKFNLILLKIVTQSSAKFIFHLYASESRHSKKGCGQIVFDTFQNNYSKKDSG